MNTRALRHLFIVALFVGHFQAVSAYAAEIQWTNLSSQAGDLPVPGESTQQTGNVVADFDLDGDQGILNKPSSRNAPPIDIWLNNGTGPRVVRSRHRCGLEIRSARTAS
jgi:hypothetical protein